MNKYAYIEIDPSNPDWIAKFKQLKSEEVDGWIVPTNEELETTLSVFDLAMHSGDMSVASYALTELIAGTVCIYADKHIAESILVDTTMRVRGMSELSQMYENMHLQESPVPSLETILSFLKAQFDTLMDVDFDATMISTLREFVGMFNNRNSKTIVLIADSTATDTVAWLTEHELCEHILAHVAENSLTWLREFVTGFQFVPSYQFESPESAVVVTSSTGHPCDVILGLQEIDGRAFVGVRVNNENECPVYGIVLWDGATNTPVVHVLENGNVFNWKEERPYTTDEKPADMEYDLDALRDAIRHKLNL